ncbi:MAG: hypothetical protein M1829_001780 [Trizodia sp. TS-e1964]|nr:MAG: hypothetical protein M1829_001780 [Trizodia sp. TS-e1964]
MPSGHSSSASSVSCISAPHSLSYSFSSSVSSLSLAFKEPVTKGKRSPRLQATEGLVHASTANSLSGNPLLQPRLFSGDLLGLFPAEEGKKPEKDEDKKIKALSQRLLRLGISEIKEEQIEFALHAKYSNGDPEKAFDLLMLFEDSAIGLIKDYNPNTKLLGAENRNGVTCYLDALLFAMFARLESFEAILYNTFNDEQRKKLATVLRLWVNMLRMGKLITVDITKNLQDSLAECGWKEAARPCQQDASEAFSFITEKLELPLLTLKMDIYHTGKEDTTDDHKFVNERLLEVAIPTDIAEGQVVTLEDCLETYFNNRIEVRRHLERQGTANSVKSLDFEKGTAVHIETVEVPDVTASQAIDIAGPSKNPYRQRATSIIRKRVIVDDELASDSSSVLSGHRKSSVRKEVMMPAWQFFSLIPWYTDNAPCNDAQVAAHFSSKRPTLGLCLKRYSFLPTGKAVRLNTHIDIPLEIGLPHFIQDDNLNDDGPLFGNFKLSLQSVVCHRGESVDSGHYISLVRGDPKATTLPRNFSAGRRQGEEDTWLRFDDLAKERITEVDITETLKKESPYLLFYQVQPIDEDPFHFNQTAPPPVDQKEIDSGVARLSSDPEKILTPTEHIPADEPSPKLSFDQASPDDTRGRPSVTFDSVRLPVEGNKSEQESGLSSATGTGFFSRSRSRARRNGGSKSRSSSQQPGENTKGSSTFSRITNKMLQDKSKRAEITTESVDDSVVTLEERAIITVEEMADVPGRVEPPSALPELVLEEKEEKEKTKKEKRKDRDGSRSRADANRRSYQPLPYDYSEKSKAPDRECSVM